MPCWTSTIISALAIAGPYSIGTKIEWRILPEIALEKMGPCRMCPRPAAPRPAPMMRVLAVARLDADAAVEVDDVLAAAGAGCHS